MPRDHEHGLFPSAEPAPKPAHKDKLAETKKQEAAIHEAHKREEREAKEASKKKHHGEAAAFKAVRALNLDHEPDQKHSKRAEKEHREAERHAEKAATATMCEHGVNRCKICFPHKVEIEKEHERPRNHPKEKVGVMPEEEE